ncbi:TonB-dependent receptor [Pontibacter beigongshangensis]|uniref:TonB-dependent receptor n=1 Tax=Pontibacter beigongshangensis TaxID=2574733 RepID=UPI001650CC38|nr:TonB-dependent receptor [Pontibacter beigongshangensis]
MRQFYRGILLLLLTAISCLPHAFAQEAKQPPVSVSLNQQPFPEFVRAVEAATDYRFFYNPAYLDSLTVTVQVKDKPLETVLEQVLGNTAFKFAIDAQNKVYITKGKQIQVNLPEGFFEIQTGTTEKRPVLASDFMPADVGSRRRASSELKLYEVGVRSAKAAGKATLSGRLHNAATGEPVIGVSVYLESPMIGTVSDQDGFYTLSLPVGRHQLIIKGMGMQATKRQILLHSDGKLDIALEEDARMLKEVLVEADKDKNVTGLQMGVEKLDIRTIKQVPTAFGESDILRVVLTLPGVKSVGEGSTGMNVRGGSTDQNLILFNGATIYNPSHLFGFFSAFNPDIVQSAELFKSAIPARYGGRLASVLEIKTREGNKKKLAGAGGIGLLTSRLTLEGPIVSDKTSFIIGGRSTYSNWLLRQLPSDSFNSSTASFYDVNAHISHEIDEKNSLSVTGYTSKDAFRLSADTLYRFSNHNASVKWNRTFDEKLFGEFTGAFSHYGYGITSNKNPENAFELDFGMNQGNVQADFTYFPNPKRTINFGINSILYSVSPGSFMPNSPESLVAPDKLQNEKALETAIYLSEKFDLTDRLSVEAGLRYSLYNALGPRRVLSYATDAPRTETTVQDTAYYKAGDPFATYHGPEYRLSARYGLSDNSSVKLSYNRLRQYIHMLSNTVSMSPTDVWKLSDSNIRPQVGNQVALGYYQNFRANTLELSVEGYYKTMRDFLDYKSGASLFMNHHIETDVVNAQGKAYGAEVMLKKLSGRLNGWISYTYSRTLIRVNTSATAEVINNGAYYPSNFDKPHDFTLISNYQFSKRISTSFNFTYSTGRPITLPIARYQYGNSQRVLYSDRNAYRVPDYYRADIAINLEGNHRIQKLAHSSWTLAVYNLTGRKNPYSVFFKAEEGEIRGYQLSIFGQPIPTLTYNFKF